MNKTARGAGVVAVAQDPSYRLVVHGRSSVELSHDDLGSLPQRTAALPIACVEGWSATAIWRGVPLADLLAAAGEDVRSLGDDDMVVVESLQRGGRYRSCEVPARLAADRDTLVALELNGGVLDLDHGYPARLIAPNRPGVLQTKWVSSVRVRRAEPT